MCIVGLHLHTHAQNICNAAKNIPKDLIVDYKSGLIKTDTHLIDTFQSGKIRYCTFCRQLVV